MLKNILKLNQVHQISNSEAKNIFGGIPDGCWIIYDTILTREDCLSEGGIFSSATNRCRLIICND